jgi:hypothetical protein
MRRALAAILVTGLASGVGCLLGACKADPGGEGASCDKKDDCADGLSCLDGTCTKLAATDEAEPSKYCATLEALAGSWTFDTTVVGAEDLASRGINGHFQMAVTLEGCTGTIELTKTGHDDTVYSKAKIQHSQATLRESPTIPGAAMVVVSLKDKPTHELTFMVRDGQLLGHFRYVESEWDRTGMWGYLRGVPAGQALAEVENFEVQPCEVKCLTQCDADRRKADQTLDEPALAACMSACTEPSPPAQPPVGCAIGKPMHEQLLLGINGPAKSIDELCSKAGAELIADTKPSPEVSASCKREPEVGGKPTERALGKTRFEGSFLNAQLLELGYFDVGYTGHLILALETEAGWFWSDSIADLSVSGMGGATIGVEEMTLRPRELFSAIGRELIAEVEVRATDSDLGVNEVSIADSKLVVVCSTGSPPVCVRATTTWSSERTLIDPKGDSPKQHPNLSATRGELYLSILPGDLVSISAPPDARPSDRALAGIYAWPK